MPNLSQLRQLRRRDASPSLVLVIVCAGVVLASLDLFIVNLAMPSMARDLHQRSLSTLSWVLNGYAIVYASLLVLLGRLSEARARQNGFLAGALLFTLASAACGAATSLGMLISFRVIQAIGAALLTPASLSMVLATTAPAKRPGAVRAGPPSAAPRRRSVPSSADRWWRSAGAGCSSSTCRSDCSRC